MGSPIHKVVPGPTMRPTTGTAEASRPSDDGQHGGEDKTLRLKRRIIEKEPRRVTFENVSDRGRDWARERHVVTLIPSRRWHAEGSGNYQESVLECELTAVAPGRTRFDMCWKSRPAGTSEWPPPR